MGRGSASPVLSTTSRRKAGTTPRSRLEWRSLMADDSSPRMVQHRHPDCSSTIVSSIRSSRWWSSPISPNSLISTAVSASAGSASRRCNSVVLPEPRKPVIRLTGVKTGSAMKTLQPDDEVGIERIAGPAQQLLGGGPQMTEILDQLGLAGRRRQDERARLPVAERQLVIGEHPAGAGDAMCPLAPSLQGIDVAREDSGTRGGIGPVTAAAEDAAERAHQFVVPTGAERSEA